jgi:hypothetical protein
MERRGSGDVEERAHTCIGDRHFRILGDEKIMPGEVAKPRIPTESMTVVTWERVVWAQNIARKG